VNRCAMYARYSTDRQNPCSIEDQIRKSSEYAESHGWLVLPEHIYRDEALSGVGADREGFTRLMAAALSAPRPFDTLLLDDTSRISRSLAEAARVFEHLNFAGIRILALSQGIDSEHEQADVLFTVHGLVHSLYLKELSKKTHRGLDGRVLRGFMRGVVVMAIGTSLRRWRAPGGKRD
jgi:site-specific DNA recombinase